MLQFITESEDDRFYDIETQKGKHIKISILKDGNLKNGKVLVAYVWNNETCEWKQFLKEDESTTSMDELASKVEKILSID